MEEEEMRRPTRSFIIMMIVAGSTGSVEAQGRIRGFNNFAPIGPTPFHASYFTYGQTDHTNASAGQDVKFQISVKTKVFQEAKSGWGWVNGLTLAYTQLSIFDINGRSAPFRATNYNPELTLVWNRAQHPWIRYLEELRLSLYDHHSTGVGATSSRRWERMYADGRLDWNRLLLGAKVWIETPYKDGLSSRNEDIEEYLGHGALSLRYGGAGDRFVSELGVTKGTKKGPNLRVELSWRPGKLDFHLFGQYYQGYGEELTDYNVKTRSGRVGIRFN
jgi:outer membrane phospholipase A